MNSINVMGSTNDWSFILAAYVAGFLFVAGYAVWAFCERRRLQRILIALRGASK